LGIMMSKALPNSTSCFCKSITGVSKFGAIFESRGAVQCVGGLPAGANNESAEKHHLIYFTVLVNYASLSIRHCLAIETARGLYTTRGQPCSTYRNISKRQSSIVLVEGQLRTLCCRRSDRPLFSKNAPFLKLLCGTGGPPRGQPRSTV
jgi:hypothetical protein